ncbi:cobalamin adenosyltransferase [Bacteroidia bacterium]|nr:cobalamin adenosyltransferase [Bacteroidia bacterium]
MKIYTKTGDSGTTSLIGGARVPKNSLRLEAYGGVDELNSFLGMIRSFPIARAYTDDLVKIQNTIFNIGGNLATAPSQTARKVPLTVTEDDIVFLEERIDTLTAQLPVLNSFVLPGGEPASASCHVARTVCRRVERRILDMYDEYEVKSQATNPQQRDGNVLKYINRLSDYLFVLARKLTVDAGVEEKVWEN